MLTYVVCNVVLYPSNSLPTERLQVDSLFLWLRYHFCILSGSNFMTCLLCETSAISCLRTLVSDSPLSSTVSVFLSCDPDSTIDSVYVLILPVRGTECCLPWKTRLTQVCLLVCVCRSTWLCYPVTLCPWTSPQTTHTLSHTSRINLWNCDTVTQTTPSLTDRLFTILPEDQFRQNPTVTPGTRGVEYVYLFWGWHNT